MRRWMLWPGALSAVFLLQCGDDSKPAARRSPGHGGTAGRAGAGMGGSAGACVGCSGQGGVAGAPAAGTSGSAGSARGGAGGTAVGAGNAGSPAAGKSGASGSAGMSGSSGVSGSSGSSGASADGGRAGEGPVEGTLTLSKLSAYQAVEVTLVAEQGALRAAPIVVGRRALFRIFLTPEDVAPGEVTGTLTVDDGTTSTEFTASVTLSGPSVQDALETTLNFDVPGARITAATTLRLVVSDGQGERLRFPETGSFALEAETSHGDLQVVIVPLVVNGFSPDLSDPMLKAYGQLLRGMLPVPDVDVTVRLPYTLDYDVNADGAGWDEALDELYTLRAADDPEDNVYYYGVLSPAATMGDWCPDGCTVGLSVVASASEVEYRGSIGAGFFESPRDTFSPETMVHELGHAMGRDHSPCGTDDADPRFPYSNGSIGSWGLYSGDLRDPTVDADVMGYCVPVWVSDYTFDRVFTRLAYVNGQVLPPKLAPAPASRSQRERVRTLTVRADGTLGWGREKPGSVRRSGTPTAVELLDAGGNVLSVVSAPFARFDHLPGGFISLPAAALSTPGLASVRAVGRSLRWAP